MIPQYKIITAGGDVFDSYPNQHIQMPIQKTILVEPKKRFELEVAKLLIDYGVFWWILGFAIIGLLTVFRKRIMTILGFEIRRLP
jgi:hypothetical protein